jgi:hypothetical protein
MTPKERMHLEQKVVRYFEHEYEWSINAKDRNIGDPWEIVQNATQRMLGVSSFCQTLGIEYDFLEGVFEDYKERIETVVL